MRSKHGPVEFPVEFALASARLCVTLSMSNMRLFENRITSICDRGRWPVSVRPDNHASKELCV